jgi:hypothetical protein
MFSVFFRVHPWLDPVGAASAVEDVFGNYHGYTRIHTD